MENGTSPRKLLSIETRLRRLFANSKMSELMQSHRKPQTDKISSIHESEAWNELYSDDGTFGGDDSSWTLC